MKIITTIRISGENFAVEEFEKKVGINAKKKTIKGQISTFGRYKGTLNPYSCIFIKPQDIFPTINSEQESFDLMIDFGLKNKEYIYGFESNSVVIDIAIYYSGQCNWELSSEQITKLHDFGAKVLFSCYELNEEELNSL